MRMLQRAQEVAEAIAADVLAGRLEPGDRVPTVARSPGSWALRPALPRGHTASCAMPG